MKVDERALRYVHTIGGGGTPPRVGLTSNTLPKAQSDVFTESSQTGVSTRSAHIAVLSKAQKEKMLLIGMPYAPPTVERKKHTTI